MAEKTGPNFLSQADFARRRGVARKTVTAWKQKELLVLDEAGRVDVEATEWNLDQRPATYRGGVAHRPLRAAQGNRSEPKPAKAATAPKRPAEPAPSPLPDAGEEGEPEFDPDNPNLPLNLAVQRKENYLGLQRKQDHAVKQGALVDRPAAEAAFFDEARAIRDAWIAWPARVAIEMANELKVDARTLTQVLAAHVNQHLAELGEPSDLDLSRHQ